MTGERATDEREPDEGAQEDRTLRPDGQGRPSPGDAERLRERDPLAPAVAVVADETGGDTGEGVDDLPEPNEPA